MKVVNITLEDTQQPFTPIMKVLRIPVDSSEEDVRRHIEYAYRLQGYTKTFITILFQKYKHTECLPVWDDEDGEYLEEPIHVVEWTKGLDKLGNLMRMVYFVHPDISLEKVDDMYNMGNPFGKFLVEEIYINERNI